MITIDVTPRIKEYGRLTLLFLDALLTACRTLEHHLVLNRRLFVSCTSAELTQYTGTLIFLLEAA